jgi:hypothetical protein
VNPNLRDAVLNNHLVYFSDKILPLNQFSDGSIDPQKDSRSLYLSEQDYTILSDHIKTIEPTGEKLSTDSLDEVEIVEFSPNRLSLETSTGNQQFLTMLQTNFKGWKAFIDNQPTPIYTSNFNFRTILLPEGKHVVRFEYKNNKILVLYFISNFVFIICALFLLGNWIYKVNPERKLSLFIPLTLLAFILIQGIRFLTVQDTNLKMYEACTQPWLKKDPIFSYQPDFRSELPEKNSILVDTNMEFLNIAEIVNEDGILKNGTLVVRAKVLPDTYRNAIIVSQILRNDKSLEWHSTKIENHIESLGQWNDLFYIRNFYKLEQNDAIQIYIWNNGRSRLRIADISVDYY